MEPTLGMDIAKQASTLQVLHDRGPLICSSPLSRPLKRCSRCQDHGQCSEQSLAACLKGNDVLARREHDLADRHHASLADGFPNDSKGLLTDLPVGSNVIGIVQVSFAASRSSRL